ncbi:MAG: hypothetical protein O8C61_09995 [Candidatus Methanoperedens sp.]|nr:hypothetical protein [Candidatus Methanoperedens sp.]
MAEIPQLLENAWKTFCEFNKKRYRYDKQPVCWKEKDVMGHLMRFLYEEFKNNKVNNLDIHLECSLTSNNFDNESCESFRNSLRKLQKQFGKHKGVEVDMAISNGAALPFELCLEAKHFHYPDWREPAEELIIKDIERLKAYKNLKIAKSIAFAVLDDYFVYEEQDKSDLIEDILNKYKNEMQILYYHYP